MSRRLTLLALPALLWACSGTEPVRETGEIPFTPDRPELGAPGSVAPYTGDDASVKDAQARYVTGLDLHRKFVLRTCGPTNGVCHNQKEYPDLHTAGTFLAAVGAPCNVQPGSWEGVFDRCERLGDRFRLEGATGDVEIGWLELIPGPFKDYSPDGDVPSAQSPGLHLVLRTPLPTDRPERYGSGTFVRSFINDAGDVQDIAFASFTGSWWVLGDGKHLFAEVRDYQLDAAAELLRAGIVQGDHNRNGVFGHDGGNTVPLLNPGKPEESYLVARMRGHMQGVPVPGTRMPLANIPPSVVDMLALMCWLEGLDPKAPPTTLDTGIDYNRCSYSADPSSLNVVGTGVTWKAGILPLLQSRCGGCHGGTQPQQGLDVMNDDPATPEDAAHDVYLRLMAFSTQKPTVKLVSPGAESQSYLWLKLIRDGSIVGQQMPIDPLGQGTALPDDALNAVQQWIAAGALED